MDIKHYYENTTLTMDQIAQRLGTNRLRVHNYVKRNYTADYRSNRKRGCYRRSKLGDLNPMQGRCAEDHPHFKGVVDDGKGYLLVLKPEWYTGRKGSKHVFQHQVVMCEHLGITAMPKGYVVHHCDENPHNNNIDNLVMMTMAEHAALHSWTGATTISQESTAKWLEARRAGTPAMI
ncbi:P45 [Xanthomonas phage phiL7]|uniref:p45 n=1 Tax=Xanthomonas phage phiL7 TaxID=538979 RepID=C4ML45_9CAUD|nr:HNH endonuclease [Xanthomonas phage phiL7]ACE75785.1 P45 [Xanthomonas phage phiL7]